MAEIKYRSINKDDTKEIALLHLESLQDGLIHSLGEKYAQIFYHLGLSSGNCFGFVALDENNKIVGAAVASKNIDKLHRLLLFNPVFAIGLLKKIFQLKKLYPSGTKKANVKEEFILFFVNPECRNLYIALNLMKMVDQKYAQLGISRYSLEVKENNKVARQLYQYFGFKETHFLGEGDNKRIFYVKETDINVANIKKYDADGTNVNGADIKESEIKENE